MHSSYVLTHIFKKYILFYIFDNILYFQIVDEAFSKDLQAAIMASKIENIKTQKEIHQKVLEETKKQSKKPMSLQDFNKMDLNGRLISPK